MHNIAQVAGFLRTKARFTSARVLVLADATFPYSYIRTHPLSTKLPRKRGLENAREEI